MTQGQANEISKAFFDKCEISSTRKQKYMILLSEALHKQVKKKPAPVECFVPMYICPNCKERIIPAAREHGNSNDNYCGHCGQRLDWSDEK